MRAMSAATSCSPVPEADTMPMSPRGTTLAKASGVPAMSAVPQSGPIIRSPRSPREALQRDLVLERHVVGEEQHVQAALERAARLVRRRTRRAPRSAPGSPAAAAPVRRRARARAAGTRCWRRPGFRTAACRRAASRRRRSARRARRIAMTRSLGVAASPSFASSPAPRRSARFDGLPIMTAALLDAGAAPRACATRASAPPSRGSARARPG